MTTTEFEAYRAKIANDVLSITKMQVLNSIKGIIRKAKPKEVKVKVNKVKAIDVFIPTAPIPPMDPPCCYTSEEIKTHIVDAIEFYTQGEYVISEKFYKTPIKWTKNAHEDSSAIRNYIEIMSKHNLWKFTSFVDSTIEVIIYNPEVGRKEPSLADMADDSIRSIIFNKKYKLFYSKRPDCILILALQQSLTPFDTKLNKRKK